MLFILVWHLVFYKTCKIKEYSIKVNFKQTVFLRLFIFIHKVFNFIPNTLKLNYEWWKQNFILFFIIAKSFSQKFMAIRLKTQGHVPFPTFFQPSKGPPPSGSFHFQSLKKRQYFYASSKDSIWCAGSGGLCCQWFPASIYFGAEFCF